MESRATGKIFKPGLWQKAGVDNAEESSGLTDMGQITQEAGWS